MDRDATLDWTLSPVLRGLRDAALETQRQPLPGVPELTLAEAEAWTARPADEPWLVWRARRVAARLAAMPLSFSPGELLVGRPCFRAETADDQAAQAAARAVLAEIPAFPGGDCGHLHPDWPTLFGRGIDGLIADIEALEPTESRRADVVALRGLSAWFERVGEACPDAEVGAVCRRIAHQAPTTLHEAAQLMWGTIAALQVAEDHYLTNPGRVDQVLRGFYEADLAGGRTTPERAFELLCCLYIQLNEIVPAGLALAVIVGGRDAAGQDVTNDLSYLALAARRATQLVYPTVGIAWHEGTPDELVDYGVRMLASGIGCPAFFGDQCIVDGLRAHGVSAADSYRWMNSTCVEIKVAGASNIWVATPYFNLAQALLDGLATAPATFDALSAAVRSVLSARIAEAATSLDATWWRRAVTGGFPLASALTADCVARGVDFDQGGCRYHWVENSFVGLANLVDGLLAVRRLVYEQGELSLAELTEVLAADWAGAEPLRRRVLTALPHYGNDQAEADALAGEWATWLMDETSRHEIGGHRYVPGFFCWIQHEHLGRQTGATPDGRRAGQPLADGAGPAQGRELCGPTAAVLSTTTWSHEAALGGLVHNVKFGAATFARASGRAAVRGVIETYLRRGGLEIQVNVQDRATLLAAQADPEQYRDLVVRVAGYSDYFVHLERGMQDEVIARTEHAV
ncbi:MAG: hypothetical protein HZB16_06610 [Armatimonadetes bacterium]|nr:hypothetical protein [Armatimonadota bacterium]